MPQYEVRFDVPAVMSVSVDVEAENEKAAEQAARQRLVSPNHAGEGLLDDFCVESAEHKGTWRPDHSIHHLLVGVKYPLSGTDLGDPVEVNELDADGHPVAPGGYDPIDGGGGHGRSDLPYGQGGGGD